MIVKILDFQKESKPGSPTIATFSAYIHEWNLKMHKMRLVRTKKGHVFAAFPCYSEERDGNKTYLPYNEFSFEKKKEIEEGIARELAHMGHLP